MKPSNIFLMADGRTVRVGDFGISKVFFSSSLLLSSLELSDTQVHEPYIRALFGTASHFC